MKHYYKPSLVLNLGTQTRVMCEVFTSDRLRMLDTSKGALNVCLMHIGQVFLLILGNQ